MADERGERMIRRKRRGMKSEAEKIGDELGKEVLDAGGREILKEVYEAQ